MAIEATDPTIEVDVHRSQRLGRRQEQEVPRLAIIRVDGIDVEYGDREPDEYQAGTRYYNTPEGWKPYPHARLIANTILEMQEKAKK